MNRLCGYRIQGLAQDTVTGNFVDRKHGFQIGGLQSIVHPPLKGEHGGVLKKHHRQRTHHTVVQREIDFTRLSGIVDLMEELRESLSQRAETQMLFDMHGGPIPVNNLLECITIKEGRV
jgi:hypothetical protein